jgi:transposase
MSLPTRLRNIAPCVRRMASKGWTADAIARAFGISRKEVHSIPGMRSKACVLDDDGLRRVHELYAEGMSGNQIAKVIGVARATVHKALHQDPCVRESKGKPPRQIHSRNGPAVRRLHFDDGLTAEAVAEELAIEPSSVADFIERLTSRQGHKRRHQLWLNRPRCRREQEALREWLRERDIGGPPLELPLGNDLVPAKPPPPAQTFDDWGSVHGVESRRRKLDDDDIRRLLELRTDGLSRRELADVFGISMATVGRLIALYRDAPPPADETPPPIAEPPSCSPPRPPAWKGPRGPRRHDPRYRDD